MFPGCVFLFILLSDFPCGMQLATMECYTLSICIYTFAQAGRSQAFLFLCPIVQSQLPRLFLRHAAFLTVLFLVQTSVLILKPHFSQYWLTESGKRMPPYITALLFFAVALAGIQIMTNRSLLTKAHAEHAVNV